VLMRITRPIICAIRIHRMARTGGFCVAAG
jgi:hypothetical protein